LRYRGFSAAERRERIESALEKVGLISRRKHYPSELSGGQQQRVAIARALAVVRVCYWPMNRPVIWIRKWRGVMELLEQINQAGTTILMVTHDPELAACAAQRTHH
jgi:putative ABC transport system ATP-binding protein